MKKALIITLSVMLGMTAFAKVKVKSGSAAFLKENATAVVVFDYSEATWEEDETYKHWCGDDYDQRVQLSVESFSLGFNKESNKLKINEDKSTAKYIITVKITNMEQRQNGMMWGQFSIRCYGIITVTDAATGEVVCTAEIKKESGKADFVTNDSITSCFLNLGKAFAKI